MTTPIDTYVTLKNGMLDTWIVTFTVPTSQSFRFADFIIKSYEINPNGSLGCGVVHFERKYDFVPYCCHCCDVAKRRNMIRFANLIGQRPSRVEMIWSPLRFKGKVKFISNKPLLRIKKYLNKPTNMSSVVEGKKIIQHSAHMHSKGKFFGSPSKWYKNAGSTAGSFIKFLNLHLKEKKICTMMKTGIHGNMKIFLSFEYFKIYEQFCAVINCSN
ncbi:unnamed protein product [Allacma fusca]|uniref:Uncharacterized protein n=1 Tax=Allacma fusca TaxID=39272 RepID=A0A8J2J1S0_9HEXA|nr:unnamed protein product [Allacma fusca]